MKCSCIHFEKIEKERKRERSKDTMKERERVKEREGSKDTMKGR